MTRWSNWSRMPKSPSTTNIIFVHGSGQSRLSYNFLEIFLPEHDSLCLEYDTQEEWESIVKRFTFTANQYFQGAPVNIVCHSYGCLVSSLFAKEYGNVEQMIALSSPWAGSRSAKWLSMVFRQSRLFRNTQPGSELLKAVSNLNLEFPISNIVSTGTKSSGNALAGMGQANDGLLTVETQRNIPESFSNVETIDLTLSHNELLMAPEVVEIIKDKIFDDNTESNP